MSGFVVTVIYLYVHLFCFGHLENPTLKILSTSHKTEAFESEIKSHTFSGKATKYSSIAV